MILVTGATGFVGCNLCRRFRAEGRPFRALVRSPEKARERGIPPEATVTADLLDGDLRAALEGVTSVVHLAGSVRALGERELERVNADGADRLVTALAEVGPDARIVHVSSLAAVGPSNDGRGSDCVPAGARPVSAYGRSKLAGEVRIAAARNPWIVLRPAIVYGPFDTDLLVMFRMLRRKRVPLIGGRARYSLVHVDDLTRAIGRAADAPATSCFLPIAHPRPLAQQEWLEAIGEAVGTRPRFVRVPRAAAAAAAAVSELWAQLRRRPALLGLDKYREMRAGSWVADPAPARAALGFDAKVEHLDGFRGTVEWYRRNGWW